ncbi:MAG TPA: hypothetical protein VK075_00090 [Pseudogracilibacillus sp.]|nr:hypothetical protein [Pseudogracilibacillus sp.]
MAFGIDRKELMNWKFSVTMGKIAFLTHYWKDERFPHCHTVTKVGCNDLEKLKKWGAQYGLKPEWIDHKDNYPHFDLFGDIQKRVLLNEEQMHVIKRFNL